MGDKLDEGSITKVADELWNYILEEVIFETTCEVHREIKLGSWSRSPFSSNFKCICPLEETEDTDTHDLLGHKLGVPINQTFPCVHCGRSVAANRYAPHLEKVRKFKFFYTF